jgi:hypothetical protein
MQEHQGNGTVVLNFSQERGYRPVRPLENATGPARKPTAGKIACPHEGTVNNYRRQDYSSVSVSKGSTTANFTFTVLPTATTGMQLTSTAGANGTPASGSVTVG